MMPETAYDRVVRAVEDRGLTVKKNGRGVVVQCPHHEDRAPSLGILPLPDSVSLCCFAGCDTADVVADLGLRMSDLFDNRRDTTYRYPDGRRQTRGWDEQRRRKTFFQSNHEGKTALFRVAEVKAAITAGQPIYLVEGEKDTLAVEAAGGVATCWAGGVAGWGHCDPSPLFGGDVVIVVDNDTPGRKLAAAQMRTLGGKVKSLRFVQAKEGKDAADHLTGGYTLDELIPIDLVTDQQEPGRPPDTHAADTDASWLPIDLTDYVNGTHKPALPTGLTRTDGVGLLYPGKVNEIHGEPESGKSLIAMAETAKQVNQGHRVIYLDYESDPATAVGRLLELGADPQALLTHLHYLRPESDPLGKWDALISTPAALLVVDGVNEALSVSSKSYKDNEEVIVWARLIKQAAEKTAGIVLLVDHVTKSEDGRGRFAIGAQSKLSVLSGAAFTVEVKQPLGRGLKGVVHLRVSKDRPGSVRPHSGPFRASDRSQLAAVVTLDATVLGRLEVTVGPPEEEISTDGPTRKPFRPTTLMEKVSKAVENAKTPMNTRAIRAVVAGKNAAIDTAIEVLVYEQYLDRVTGPRGALNHTVRRPYRAADDLLADDWGTGHGEPLSGIENGGVGSVTVPPSIDGGARGTVTQPPLTVSRGTVGHGGARSLNDLECRVCGAAAEPDGYCAAVDHNHMFARSVGP